MTVAERRATTPAELQVKMSRLVSEAGFTAGLRFVPRPSDVIIASYAKCGTTWLQQMVHSLRCLPLACASWPINERSPARASPRCGSKEDRARTVHKQECPRGFHRTKEVIMNVMIGVDPHKASHTAVAISRDEDQIASVKVRATSRQVEQLLCWAEPFEKRTWAIESVGGMGYLLAQQLVARGEDVLDVPATLAARIRVLATKRSNKNDPNDAHSIAIAALRAPALAPGRAGGSRRGPPTPPKAELGSRPPASSGRLPAALALLRGRSGRNCQGNVRF